MAIPLSVLLKPDNSSSRLSFLETFNDKVKGFRRDRSFYRVSNITASVGIGHFTEFPI